jgi:hypothetical protein
MIFRHITYAPNIDTQEVKLNEKNIMRRNHPLSINELYGYRQKRR